MQRSFSKRMSNIEQGTPKPEGGALRDIAVTSKFEIPCSLFDIQPPCTGGITATSAPSWSTASRFT
jgi:hypothetical protein